MEQGSSSFGVEMKTEMPSFGKQPEIPIVEMKTEMPSFSKQPEMSTVEMKVEMPPYTPPDRPRAFQQPSNLPPNDLLDRYNYLHICVPLYDATVKGNWKTAKEVIDQRPEVIRFSITENAETALHIAASSKSTKLMEGFVSNLLDLMGREDMEFHNRSSNTALSLAAAAGNVSIAKILVKKNPHLLHIPGRYDMLPLYIASLYGKYEMVKYLYEQDDLSDVVWTDQTRGWVLLKCIAADFFDIALNIVTKRPKLASTRGILEVLARKTNAFRETEDYFITRLITIAMPFMIPSHAAFAFLRQINVKQESNAMKLLRFIWDSILKMTKAEVDDLIRGSVDVEPEAATSQVKPKKYSSRVLFIAAEMGNARFIVELVRQYPDIIWKLNDSQQSIFHVAVSHRQESVYNLIYEIVPMKDLITPLVDVDGNNILHLAAKSVKKKRLQEVSGVALQMQRELLWYKEVEGMLPPSSQEKKNNAGILPHELFTEEHKDLMAASEKWMKDTASQCMVVSALIATIVFAAAFTVPGGYTQDTGIPIFHHRILFIVFIISDALSLTFATISILIFLYILTSRYAEIDFLETLPKKLMKGMATLFLSITAMMVAFSVTFFILYDQLWVQILIAIISSIPVILYARHQYGLLADVYHSTYGSKNLFKSEKSIP